MEDILSAWLAASNQMNFTIIIAGRISGGVFEDAIHKPIAYQIGEQALIIQFERGERLAVFHPAGISFVPNTRLIVGDASEARFAWYDYGHPHHRDNLCEEIYCKVGHFVILQRTVPRVIPPSVLDPFPTTVPLPANPFVRLVPS